MNRKHWTSIRGEVKEWVLENWMRWKEAKPEWFDLVFIASVPKDMVPKEAKFDAKVARASQRRKSSIGVLFVAAAVHPEMKVDNYIVGCVSVSSSSGSSDSGSSDSGSSDSNEEGVDQVNSTSGGSNEADEGEMFVENIE